MNNSPRVAQLADRQPHTSLPKQSQTDVCIVGAGIAGVMTAYYTLLDTDKQVILLDAHRVAHGATGHNAGQIAPYFEKPFDELVSEYGIQMAHDAQQAIREARDKIPEIIEYAELETPVHRFVGYAGCSTESQVEEHLQRKQVREQTHNDFDAIFVREDHPRYQERQTRFPELFASMSAQQIKDHLETDQDDFIALLACKKGVTNSALLCEELVHRMKKKYSDRFQVYELSPVKTIELGRWDARLTIAAAHDRPESIVVAQRVVLCTNGFENFHIINTVGEDIDQSFHEQVFGLVGYMSAYLDAPGQIPTAVSYFMPEHNLVSATNNPNDVYFYLTRRPYVFGNTDHTLISLGGPETALENITEYDRFAGHPDRAHQQNEQFLKRYYRDYPANNDFMFRRHGLMGFTKNGLRMIGPDERNAVLMYNLGCNGVGILSSIYGGWKIGQLLSGEKFSPSVFDPKLTYQPSNQS